MGLSAAHQVRMQTDGLDEVEDVTTMVKVNITFDDEAWEGQSITALQFSDCVEAAPAGVGV